MAGGYLAADSKGLSPQPVGDAAHSTYGGLAAPVRQTLARTIADQYLYYTIAKTAGSSSRSRSRRRS